MIEPSTPPRNVRRGAPATPATPRFGTFEDLPDDPEAVFRKRRPAATPAQTSAQQAAQALHQTPQRTHRRKRSFNVLATPRQTPKRRPHDAEKGQSATHVSSHFESHASRGELGRRDLMAEFAQPLERKVLLEPSRPKPTAAAAATAPHPHQEQPPPNVPGMWYVFRGKRIFRPLPPGEERPQPVTLFQDQLALDGSDAETDIEW